MNMMKVEVAYATPEKQLIVTLDVAEDCTVKQAALLSGLDKEFPGLDIEGSAMGLFGRKVAKPDSEVLKPGDRVEIYRPLLIDPKQARLNRAAKKPAK
ncbi:RnfH family protein [Reinekea marina]|nr:RnfH family protein [Reinekea marina]MBU2863433.1 RnfH family protein [Reinekea forsetii]MDN3650693.1 RnfH family protein [Reinekea marina]